MFPLFISFSWFSSSVSMIKIMTLIIDVFYCSIFNSPQMKDKKHNLFMTEYNNGQFSNSLFKKQPSPQGPPCPFTIALFTHVGVTALPLDYVAGLALYVT